MRDGNAIDELTRLLARLPGLGPRSARRAVLALLEKRESLLLPLLARLQAVAEQIVRCGVCGNLDTNDPCHICADPRRDQGLICVVEDVADLWALERAHAFQGVFHVLGGTLSALDGVTPEDLAIAGLLARVRGQPVREVVLAMAATVDGQTTAHYLAERLAGADAKVTRLAHGVPVGGELDYLDDGTLTQALRARLPLA
ncbi:MAG: recombination mediator RecR [Sphingomonadales bacterium]